MGKAALSRCECLGCNYCRILVGEGSPGGEVPTALAPERRGTHPLPAASTPAFRCGTGLDCVPDCVDCVPMHPFPPTCCVGMPRPSPNITAAPSRGFKGPVPSPST